MKLCNFRLLLVFVSLLIAGPLAAEELWQPVGSLDDLARNYVLLVLRMDKHIAGFNDYYYGPPEWKQRVDAEEKVPVAERRRGAPALVPPAVDCPRHQPPQARRRKDSRRRAGPPAIRFAGHPADRRGAGR